MPWTRWFMLLLGLAGSWKPVCPFGGQRYGLLYGGMVGEEIANTSVEDLDVAGAVKVALAAMKSKVPHGCHCKVNDSPSVNFLRKIRLYFSLDERTPFVLQQKVITSQNKVQLQRRQVVMGLLYSLVMWPSKDCHCSNEHSFTVTRDRNKVYHVYQYLQRESGLNVQEKKEINRCLTSPREVTYGRSVGVEYSPIELCGDEACEYDTGDFGALNILAYSSIKQPHCSPFLLYIATYNIWNVNSLPRDSYKERLKRLQKLIRGERVDIFCFQEVRLDVGWVQAETECQACQLSQSLPEYQYVYQPAMLRMDELFKRTEEGLAIFSKYPILSTDYILLYRNVSDEVDSHQRICLHAEVLSPYHGKVHVFVTHLSLSGDAQRKSVVQIWRYMSKFSGVKVLLGDFNVEPTSVAARRVGHIRETVQLLIPALVNWFTGKMHGFLTGEVTLEGIQTSDMYDAWVLGTSNQPGCTYNALDKRQVKRIDYIFLYNPVGSHFQVVNTTLMGNTTCCDLPCSDHLGVKTIVTIMS